MIPIIHKMKAGIAVRPKERTPATAKANPIIPTGDLLLITAARFWQLGDGSCCGCRSPLMTMFLIIPHVWAEWKSFAGRIDDPEGRDGRIWDLLPETANWFRVVGEVALGTGPRADRRVVVGPSPLRRRLNGGEVDFRFEIGAVWGGCAAFLENPPNEFGC